MGEQLNGGILAKNAHSLGVKENFTYESATSKSGKSYLRFRRNQPEYGGKPFKVVKVEQAQGDPDQHGNLWYWITVEGDSTAPAAAALATPTSGNTGDKDARIARQVAFKAAVEMLNPGKGSSFDFGIVAEAINDLTNRLVPVVTGEAEGKSEVVSKTTEVTPEPQIDPAGQTPVAHTDDDIPF